MSTQKDPSHNLVALLIGTGEFLFSEAATLAAARAAGFIDFGNVTAYSIEPDNTVQEHTGSYRGVRRVDKRKVTQTKLQYKLKCDEWNLQNLKILFGATEGTQFTQPALTATNGTALGFTTTAAVIGRWYDILSAATVKVTAAAVAAGGTGYTVGDTLTVSGGTGGPSATLTVSTVSSGAITAVTVASAGAYTTAPSNPASVTGGTGSGATFNLTTATLQAAGVKLKNLTSVTFSGKTEGTDFELDLLMGRVRFLTAQAADLTPVITCAAILSTDEEGFRTLTPMAAPLKSGWGKLTCYDQNDANKVVLNHEDFSCDVSLDAASEVNGTDYTDMTLSVVVTDTVGTIYARNQNQNAGLT